MEYSVFIFKNENVGEFMAIAPDIPECIAQRDSLGELHEVIQDLAELCLEDEELPVANSIDYFTDDMLNTLFIPLTSSKKILKITKEDDDLSYDAELLV